MLISFSEMKKTFTTIFCLTIYYLSFGQTGSKEYKEQVDKALERVEAGSYGTCQVCRGELEPQRLLADPLARVCLDCLRPDEARALERDLELAARIQSRRLEGFIPLRPGGTGQRRLL